MEEGTILRWLKAEADSIAKHVLLFQMETVKAILEVPSPGEGTRPRIMLPEGSVPIEQPLGWVREAGEAIPDREQPVAAAQTIPHIHIARAMDAAGLMEARKVHADASATDPLLFALSRVLPNFSLFAPAPGIDIAIAADTPAGVVTPVLRNTRALDLDSISRERRNLAQAGREHRLKLDQLQGGLPGISQRKGEVACQ